MDEIMINNLKTKFRNSVLLDESMSKHTSFATGGNAKVFVRPANVLELSRMISFLNEHNIKYFILGCGSNILVTDKGFSNTVVIALADANCFSKIEINDDYITCGSGVKISSLLRACLLHGLSGLEFLCGIPGTVGGALVMNAGAYGQEIGSYVDFVEVVDSDGGIRKIKGEELFFSYRHGVDQGIVVGAGIRAGKAELNQIKNKCSEYMKKRNIAQPKGNNAGSVFRNPTGTFAGKLIEEAGLKGFSVGDAFVSDKHANFIINRGKATSSDIQELMNVVVSKVKEQSGILLEPEIKIVGE